MICVPVFGKDIEEIKALAKKAEDFCNILELRIDLIDNIDSMFLKKVMDNLALPVIVTNRASWEGGNFQEGEEERIFLLEKAVEYGADFVDIEYATEKSLRDRIIRLGAKYGTKVILSHHDFEKTPSETELLRLFDNIASEDSQVIKIVTYASDNLDFLRLCPLYAKAREREKELIAFCMGRQGCYSRIYSINLGALLTFACIERDLSSAPGQIPAKDMRDILLRMDAVCDCKG